MVNWIVSSSVLIICVVLIRRLLKGRISPGLQYALWGIVLLRLLIPVNFGNSKISVENFTDDIAEAYESEATWEIKHYGTDSEFGEAYLISSDTSLVSSGNNNVLTAGNVEQNVTQVSTAENIVLVESEKAEVKEQNVNGTNAIVWLNNALVYIWAAGMAVVAVVFIYTNARFMVRTAKDRELIVEKEKWDIPVYYSDSVETPCLYGIISPKIYVNAEAIADDKAFKHVREHELTHYHHGDNVWCVFRFMALVVHWYNPLVWLAAVLSRKDSELACDAGTIKRLGESERVGYGMTLINMSCKKREALFAMATTMAGSKKNIQERVVLIAKKPKTAMRTLVAVVLVMATIMGVTFTGAVKVAELPLVMAEKQEVGEAKEENIAGEEIADKKEAFLTESKPVLSGSTITGNGRDTVECIVAKGSYPTGAKVSYVTDIYDRVMYGEKDSFMEIYAERTGMEFRLLEESVASNELVKGVYDMYNSEGLKFTYYENRTVQVETYASYSPDNAERLVELMNQYTWKQVNNVTTVLSDYMIEVSSGGALFKRGYMRFYDIGDGELVYYDGHKHTYWKAVAKSSDTVSIAEQLKEIHYNIELDLICMEIGGCEDEQEAFKFFVEKAYPATRLNLESGNPYKISNYNMRGSARETTKSKQVREGDFTFTCIPEGATEAVEKTITFTVEATEDGTWIFQYHDCDKE